jgi:hypothetical protein
MRYKFTQNMYCLFAYFRTDSMLFINHWFDFHLELTYETTPVYIFSCYDMRL